MRLLTLSAREFRNFARLEVEFQPRLNFFVGDNGQGKTNLLEAVFLLARGASFRPSEPGSFLRTESSTKSISNSNHRGRIAGMFLKGSPPSSSSLDYFVEIALESRGKTAFINGKRVNTTALMAHFPCVLFSPESLAAIKEGPDQRRQLIDEILLSHDPKKGRLLREYSRALRSRNQLLRNLAERFSSQIETERSLDSLNKIYFLLSTHLTTARIEALRDLSPLFTEALRFILDEPNEGISVDYLVSGTSAMKWSESEVYDALLRRHAELGSQEVQSGASLVGPHKHDIKVLLAGNDSRFYCSQGQQRALILALKIAQIVYHHGVHQTYPILLLDDVLSELDMKKRANLMKFLEGISAQILITSTDLTWSDQFSAGHNSIFTVHAGTVARNG